MKEDPFQDMTVYIFDGSHYCDKISETINLRDEISLGPTDSEVIPHGHKTLLFSGTVVKNAVDQT